MGRCDRRNRDGNGKHLSVSDISNVVGDRLWGAEADPNARGVAISLVIADEGVVGVVRGPVVRRGDCLLKIGIRQRDDVAGPGPQRGKIYSAPSGSSTARHRN